MKIIRNALHALASIQLEELDSYHSTMEDALKVRKAALIKWSEEITLFSF